MPGEHEEVPFLDLKAGFQELGKSYQLNLTTGDEAAKGWSRLEAVRRETDARGPEQVHIWFDAIGVAHRIQLFGLPHDEGAPNGVTLELIGHRDLGPRFFEHENHHAADRPFDWE